MGNTILSIHAGSFASEAMTVHIEVHVAISSEPPGSSTNVSSQAAPMTQSIIKNTLSSLHLKASSHWASYGVQHAFTVPHVRFTMHKTKLIYN